MKTLKIMVCALFVVCGGLLLSACGEKNKNFDISKINVSGFSVYTYDGKPHAVSVSYDGVNADVTYALKEDANNFRSIEDLGLVNVGTYNLYYRISAKGYNSFTSAGTLELTIVPKNLVVEVNNLNEQNEVVLMKSELSENVILDLSTNGVVQNDETGLSYNIIDFNYQTADYGDVFDVEWSITNSNYDLQAPEVKVCIKDYVQLNDAQGNFKSYYKNIQEAVDAAQDGETVVINNNMVVSQPINVNKSITIDGLNKYQLVAHASIAKVKHEDKNVKSVFVVNQDAELTLKNVIVNGGQSARCVTAFGGNIVLNETTLTNGKKTDDFVSGGVYLSEGATLEMLSGQIYGNDANVSNHTKYGADLFVDGNSEAIITKGNITNSFINACETIGRITLNGGTIENAYVEYDFKGAKLNYISGTLNHMFVALKNDNGSYIGVNHEIDAELNTEYVGGKLVYDANDETSFVETSFYNNKGAELVDGLTYIFEDCKFYVPFNSTKNVELVFNGCSFETSEASTSLYLTSVNNLIVSNCEFIGETTGGYAIDLNLYSTSCDNIVIANNVFNTTSDDDNGVISVKTRLGNTDSPTDEWAQDSNVVPGRINGVVTIAGNDFSSSNPIVEIGTIPQGVSTSANTTTGNFNLVVEDNLDDLTIYNKFKQGANTPEENFEILQIKVSIGANGDFTQAKQ